MGLWSRSSALAALCYKDVFILYDTASGCSLINTLHLQQQLQLRAVDLRVSDGFVWLQSHSLRNMHVLYSLFGAFKSMLLLTVQLISVPHTRSHRTVVGNQMLNTN